MSGRGKSPQPTAMKTARGNPGQRRLNDREPKPKAGIPRVPRWLDEEARSEWARVVAALKGCGVITMADRATLAAYCQSWADYVAAAKDVKKDGKTFTTPQGYVAKNPMVTILNESRTALLRYAQEFGLTPSARSRIHATGSGTEDPFDSFMGGK